MNTAGPSRIRRVGGDSGPNLDAMEIDWTEDYLSNPKSNKDIKGKGKASDYIEQKSGLFGRGTFR